MHGAVLDFVATHADQGPLDVLDVGGRDINGTPRHLFPDADTYVVVDPQEGPNVDIVADVVDVGLVEFADVVVCLEVLEHAERWREIAAACVAACRPGGQVIVTCAGPGRDAHSAIDGGSPHPGEWYGNVDAGELGDVLSAAGLVVEVCRQQGEDTQAVGRRP